MAVITVETPFNIELEFKIAEFQKRLGAWFIDLSLIITYFFLVLTFFIKYLHFDNDLDVGIIYFIYILPVLVYQLFFEIFMDGQTLGKKLLGIKIISTDGRGATWGQFFLRWILCPGNLYIYVAPKILVNPIEMLSFLFLYLPDFLSVVISARSQRLGDLAAGTVVIDKKYVPNINETIFHEIDNKSYIPLFPQVMKLSDTDINRIKDLISAKPSKVTDLYMIEITDKLKSRWGITSDLHAKDFLHQLISDYNYITSTRSL